MNPAIGTNQADATSPSGRLPQLDVLRAVAILLVLGSHPVVKFDDIVEVIPAAYAWGHIGWSGVNLFFVLSGFLIGGLLFAEMRATGTLDVSRFVIRRAFKIWPAYYVYLLVLVLILIRLDKPVSILTPFLVHIQNYCGEVETIAGHTWSLAVEEHFYLALPLLLCFVVRPRAAILMPGFAVLAIACGWLRFSSGGELPVILTHLCIDSLAFGVLLAFLFHFHRTVFDRIARQRALLLVVGFALVARSLSLFTDRREVEAWKLALIPVGLYLGYGAILMAMLAMPVSWFQSWPVRVLTLIGLYSYSIYIWHLDIAYRLVQAVGTTEWVQAMPGWIWWPIGMTAYVLVAVGAGILMARCIEMPALALRDRLFPRSATITRLRRLEETS